MPANHAIALFRECTRIIAILITGVVGGFAAWCLAAWALLAIVGAIWPQDRGEQSLPSGAQMLALMFVPMMLPVFVIVGGFLGWAFATREKTPKG